MSLDFASSGQRPEGLRLPINNVGYTDLARECTQLRSSKAPPGGAGLDQFRRPSTSHSTLHKQRKSDLKIIADQQGHGMRTHLDNYVQSAVAERKEEAPILYADFTGVLNKRG
jgi:hypothetical protein